jgi:RNA recognition motif-containing protein
MKKMFVGSLAEDTTEQDIQDLFSQYGTVRSISLITDVFSGKCKGFGFVEMEGHEARAAIAGLDGKLFKGRPVKVREEQPRANKGGRRRGRR